ncbi:aminotransferase class I/II-fold pyridoxal phosphate-dependent enzyme [Microbacterium indicum]|uniref:aminotransferase class I/II-fold pyridoxal phosphate-dependent enzyme n=1 Tax=Microbacterium indicum TaxID=358100 RepID=UPI00041598D0|nr:aminotransferase class I/II-fold pyridoxal phosphate-dependent enzyme [Microbacterium indicum]
MTPITTAGVLAQRVDEPSPSGIAASLAQLIAEGTLAPGDRLPTVRDLARALGVSPATVSTAWGALAGAGTIVARGRAGTFVRGAPAPDVAPRTRRLDGHTPATRLDLSRGTPDPALLPGLARAFERSAPHASTASYHDQPLLPRLERLLRRGWPAPSHRLTAVSGALDGIDRVLGRVARFGDRVVVERPTFPPLYDLLDVLGLVAVPVEIDDEGILPDSLAEALSSAPSALLLQPRAQNPTGASMTPGRAADLARVIAGSPRGRGAVVIEDDHSGAIAQSPAVSLAEHLPEQTVLIRSFSKSHGPDLRIAALGGPDNLIARVEARRSLGPWWVPRLIQHVVAELLTDGESIAEVARARAAYAARQRRFAAALGRDAADGVNAWIPVENERAALVHLAAQGIRAAAGSPFFPEDVTSTADGRARIRVTVGAITGDVPAVAASIARAAAAS